MAYQLQNLLKTSESSLTQIIQLLNNCPSIDLSTLNPNETALIIVDMINGFIKTGPMSSQRIQSIIDPICHLLKQANYLGIEAIAFADCHQADSIEFDSYPPHCLKGDIESEIVDEIKLAGYYQLIEKSSTNGFLEPVFHEWLNNHPSLKNFIIVGDCTDICVEQFAVTLKTYFVTKNQQSRLIVPINGVQTYDLDVHAGDFMNVIALYKMMMNGVEIVTHIEE